VFILLVALTNKNQQDQQAGDWQGPAHRDAALVGLRTCRATVTMAGMENANERIEKLEGHSPCSDECGRAKEQALIAARIWRETQNLMGTLRTTLNVDTDTLFRLAEQFDETAWKNFENVSSHEPRQRAPKPGFQTRVSW
jgi:hypothetical protein